MHPILVILLLHVLCIHATQLRNQVQLQSQAQSLCYNRDQAALDALPTQNIGELFAQVATTNYRVNSYQLWQSSNCVYNFNPLTKFAWQTTGANMAQLSSTNGCFETGAKFYLWINAEAAVCGYMVPVTFVYQPKTAASVIVYFTGTVDIIYDNVVTMPTYTVSNLYALLDTTNYAMTYYSMWQSTYCSYDITASPTVNGVTTNFDFPTIPANAQQNCFLQGAIFYVWANPAAAVLAYMSPMKFIIDFNQGAIMQLSYTGTVDNVDSSIMNLPIYHVSGINAVLNTRAYQMNYYDAWQSSNCVSSFGQYGSAYKNETLFYNSVRTQSCFQEGTYNTIWVNPIAAVKAYMVPAIFYINYQAPPAGIWLGGTVDGVNSNVQMYTGYNPVSTLVMDFTSSQYNITQYRLYDTGAQCNYYQTPTSNHIEIDLVDIWSYNNWNRYACFAQYSQFTLTLYYGANYSKTFIPPVQMFIMYNVSDTMAFQFLDHAPSNFTYGYLN